MGKDKILKLINIKINESEIIKTLLLPSIGFKLTQTSKKNKLNHSKIGGHPFFFNNDDWPIHANNSLTFLGQIALNQINEINNILPKKGILYFFISTNDIGYRYPDKKGEFKVIYIENPNKELFLKNILKENIKVDISETFMNFYESYTFPSYQEGIIKKNNITDEVLEIIDDIETEIMYSLENDYDIEHQLLGHPKAIQGAVKFWWAKKYLGIEQKEEFSKDEITKIQDEEDNFILILQLNFGDSKIEFDYFGDSVAYFGIHKNDLKNRNFENIVLVMQNT